MKRLLTSAVVVALALASGRAQAGGDKRGGFTSGPSVHHNGSVGGNPVNGGPRLNTISLPPGGTTIGTTIGKPISTGLHPGSNLQGLPRVGANPVKTLPVNLNSGLPGKNNGGPMTTRPFSPDGKPLNHELVKNSFVGRLGDKGPPLLKPGTRGVLPIARGPGGAAVKDYHLTHGTRFTQGTCYKGQHHNHWTYSCWHPRYNCCCYWDPCCLAWYYWCETRCCYYPISYATAVAPTPVIVTAPVVIGAGAPDAVVTETLPAANDPAPPASPGDVPPPPPFPGE